ncbi:MAG: GNAT family N-acetyltransferase [Proteobacteria bacterium]|nr:GNAT family N-acetyltransferase [Pseudomonadota bacterium]
MKVEVRPASEQDRPVLDRLLQYYLHDFSEFDQTVRSDHTGRFAYPYLEFYWRDPDRFAFLIWYAGQLAGLALVRKETDPGNGERITELAEFFILRALRRGGVGRLAAQQLWGRFPGRWRVEVSAGNAVGYQFWGRVVQEATDGRYSQSLGRSGVRQFTFQIPAPDETGPVV